MSLDKIQKYRKIKEMGYKHRSITKKKKKKKNPPFSLIHM